MPRKQPEYVDRYCPMCGCQYPGVVHPCPECGETTFGLNADHIYHLKWLEWVRAKVEEGWFREPCPKCSRASWVLDGQAEPELPYIDGIRCWHCKHEFLIINPDSIDGMIAVEKGPWFVDGERRAI